MEIEHLRLRITVAHGALVNTGDRDTHSLTGTSMAAPHVTGAAALYLSAHPEASPAEVQQALLDNATSGRIANAGSGTPDRLLRTGGLGTL
ncbi:hypothetical protein Sgleb_13860 [Streptomyces glebosus]|uniref:Peptidase S8/S53 domain-containing protein n=1 Tax=Streptomyces glebosus TaxID=249580 RepID=A0A640SPK7_9ACTN|nr:hypothetical protein Sgleb_13860 [Streptomyces glebosus]GHG66367.1 hypothetical protein GCM10010513_35460 [Streptomyces glebosus]